MEKLEGKNIEDIFALTPVQSGMLFHYLKEPLGNQYCEQLRLEISGDINPDIFEKAWTVVTGANEMLRAFFRWEKLENPVQMILKEYKPCIRYCQLADQEGIEQQRLAPFDLHEVPFRVTLCKMDDHRSEMIVSNHHILYDGWSLGILLKEFFQAYGELARGNVPQIPTKTKFREFVKKVRDRESPGQEAFWRNYLQGIDRCGELSIKRKGKSSAAGDIEHIRLAFPEEINAHLEMFTREFKITPAILFYTAWGLLLQRYNNNDDVIFGITDSGRSGDIDGIENIVGLFINTLPLRVQSSGGQSLADILYRIRESMQNMELFKHTPLTSIKRSFSPDAEAELFDTLLVIESYPFDFESLKVEGISAGSYSIIENTNYDLAAAVLPFKTLEVDIGYKKELFDKETVVKLFHHFTAVIKAVISNPEMDVARLDILSQKEKEEILYDFNGREPGAPAPYPLKKNLHQLFEEQAEKRPNDTALVSKKSLSYRELNEKSQLLAYHLRNRGFNGNKLVGLMVDRSQEMIVGILGILKAGCAYVPLNPNAPDSRTGYMLQECNVRLLLTRRSLINGFSRGVDYVFLEDEENYREIPLETTQSQVHSGPGDFAYVIFTSGSSGTPKGVPITHANLSPLLHWGYERLGIGPSDRVLQNLSYYFDWSVWEIFITLTTGACLYLATNEVLLKPAACVSFMEENRITALHVTPTQYGQILQVGQKLSCLKYLFLGAEKLSHQLVARSFDSVSGNCRVFNMYGPTEATIISAVLEIHRESFAQFATLGSIPIGKAAGNAIHLVLDKYLNLCPVTVAGELYIGGDGVSAGYLNNPELTADKFFRSYGSYRTYINYKTGDLARWLSDGHIEFLGRTDKQVKIRGYRIELGEIQARIAAKPGVKDVVLTTREDKNGDNVICAYFITGNSREFSVVGLRQMLLKELPDYMIPAHFIKVDAFPLNPNGKIAIRQLPDPGELEIETGNTYVPPQGAIEQKLLEIWQKVLNREHIGVKDDFFVIGGDSIKAIQIASRMNKEGLDVELKSIFTNPTISELAPLVKELVAAPYQEAVIGQVPLTPIQKEFFAFSLKSPHHFNMGALLFSKERLEEKTLEAVFSKIQEHHDALRMVYREEGGKIIQLNQGLDYPLHWHVFDYRGRTDARAALKEQMEIINKSMDLAVGPLMKIALFHLDDGDYLSIIIHHLVVDGISWRILLEDIDTLFRQYREGKPLALPLKTGSFKEWAEKLTEYAGSETLLAEKSYWERMNLVPVPPMKRDFDQEKNEVKDMVKLSFQLKESETRQLLSAVHYAFHTEVNDILLTALGMALKSVFGQRRFAVSLEGHGREGLFPGFNINRTMGWFTSIYPVILNCPDTPGLDRAIKETKETLHRVPNKGIGYGILNHLTARGQKETNGFKLKPQISFNYLGEFEGGRSEEGQSVEKLLWASGEELITNSIGPDEQRRHDLDISGSVTNKRLNMTIMYNPGQYREETVKALWNHYEDQLRRIISFCITREKPELTPCDLTYKDLSIEKVEQLSTQYEVEDIYALSPMQSGMLFSSLKEGDSTVYFEQMSYRLEGEFDIQLIEKALEALFKRHQVLRTVFISEGLKEPLQVVLKAVNAPGAFCFEDLRRLSCDEEKNSFIREYKKQDLQRSFNLSKDILCRLALFRITDRKYEFAWSFHHILLDGWSVGILNSEFFQYYSSIANGRDAALPAPSPYRNYIEWLQRVDKDASRSYWRNYLEGCQQVAGIPQRNPRKTREKIYKSEEVILILKEAISIGLKQLAGKYHVTLNTVIQAVWGVILGKYNNTRDVVFGTVVSGRPPQIKGIESMVGLFLNTIPVRIRFEKDSAFHSLLTEIQQRAAAGEPYHYLSLAEIQAQSVLKNDLPDHILVFENYPMEEKLAIGVGAGKISEIESFEQVNYGFHIMIIPGSRLKIILKYNSSVFQRLIIERVGHHLKHTFSQVLDCETIEIEKIKFFEEGEKQKLLDRFNDDLDNE